MMFVKKGLQAIAKKKGPGNARQTHATADNYHRMFGFGIKKQNNDGSIERYKSNAILSTCADEQKEEKDFLENFGLGLKELIASKFEDDLKDITNTEDADISDEDCVFPNFVKTIDISQNLGNASHYDASDASPGIGIWFRFSEDESIYDPKDRWYFILPNLSIVDSDGKESKGVAIKLHHGAMIKWDGRYVKHCTMHRGDIEDKDIPLFGVFAGAKSKFTKEGVLSNELPLMKLGLDSIKY